VGVAVASALTVSCPEFTITFFPAPTSSPTTAASATASALAMGFPHPAVAVELASE
jgi:hypothetical protein